MKRIFLILCILMLGITGCNDEVNGIESTATESEAITYNNISEKESTVPVTSAVNQPTKESAPETDAERGEAQLTDAVGGDDAAALGVNKKIVWIVPDANCPKEEIVSKFNELLVKKYGCDFVVEFRTYYTLQNFKSEYTYYDMVMDMKRLGHQADVLFCGTFRYYSSFVEEGIYEPFNDYFLTDDGKKLYEAYAPEIWKKTERNGNVYGYLSEIYPSGFAMAICNEENAKKYGITVPQMEWSFYDVEKYIEAAGVTQESIGNKEVLLAAWPNALMLLEGYYECSFLFDDIYFKADGMGGWTAVDISKETDYIKLMKKIKEYSDKGWYTCMFDYTSKGYSNESVGKFVFDFVVGLPEGINITKEKFVCKNSTVSDIVSGKTVFGGNELMENMINGVTSWSEYKDEAFKLITLVNTESELSNLLQYGIEGVDYEYKNSMVTTLSGSRYDQITIPTRTATMANMNILHNVLADPADKIAYSKEVSENCPAGVTMLYDIDMSGYETQLEKISAIYSEYEKKLFKAEYDDVEVAIAEMGAALAEAGIDKVIEELNRQMKGQ